MDKGELIILPISIAIFLLIILLMVIMRMRTGGKFEVKSPDILIAFIPIAMWMVFSGQVKVIEFAGFRIESAFIEALGAKVKEQAKLPVEEIATEPKAGLGKIRELISNKTEGLSFSLGRGYYVGSIIDEYLNELTRYPFFKYVVINDQTGKFYGLIEAGHLQSSLSQPAYKANFDDFARWLNRADRTALSNIPGFIGNKHTITKDTEKQTALQEMEDWDLNTLPVLNEKKEFFGVVERNRLISSLILEVAKTVR